MIGYKIVKKYGSYFKPVLRDYPNYFIGEYVSVNPPYWYYDSLAKCKLDKTTFSDLKNICIIEIDVRVNDILEMFDNSVCICKGFKPLRVIE